MKVGLVIYSNDSETVWNAFRFGNFTLNQKDEVNVFLLAKGVESESLDTVKFKVTEQMKNFVGNGGKIFACGCCLENRQRFRNVSIVYDEGSIHNNKRSDKIVTF